MQRSLPFWILCGDAGGAFSRMAGLRLNTAYGKHEATCAVAPVGAQCQSPRHMEGRDDCARYAQFDAFAQPYAYQGVVYQSQPFLQRGAHMINKLYGRGASAAFGPVHNDEVGCNIGMQHGFGYGKPLPGVAYA